MSEVELRTLNELYGEKDQPWRDRGEPIIRFWESDTGECWGFPFLSLSAARFVPQQQPYSQRLILYFPIARIAVTGNDKVFEFFEALARQRATLLKADGKDILSVKATLNGEKEP
jgi:hypothetical protein